MSYITTMAVPEGIIMAADRMIVQHMVKLDFNAPEGFWEEANTYNKPITRTARKLFTIGGNIGIAMGQTAYTNKGFR